MYVDRIQNCGYPCRLTACIMISIHKGSLWGSQSGSWLREFNLQDPIDLYSYVHFYHMQKISKQVKNRDTLLCKDFVFMKEVNR